ncbi:MAG: hypothetical protein KDK70_22825 [Myxococcales bacterium]|nr:hypothetical protein [Myxococcales bacterium]
MSDPAPPDHDPAALARIEALAASVAEDFKTTRRILSFDEWFALLCAEPTVHARSAAQYVRDAFEHFGTRGVRTPKGQVQRYSLFDSEFDGWHRLVGQEEAQNELYEAIEGFVRLGRVNKLLLLHGPNGSAKSTMLESLQRALEVYSRTDRGALYRFAWVFPNRRKSSGGIGFSANAALRDALGEQHPRRVHGLHGLALALLARDRPGPALARLEQAMAIGDAAQLPPLELAEPCFSLAQALPPQERSRARALAERAAAAFRAGGSAYDARRQDVEAWLTTASLTTRDP